MMHTEHQITQHIRWGYALPFGDIAPFGRNVVYAESAIVLHRSNTKGIS